MLKSFGLNEVLIHEIDFRKEIFNAVNKAAAGVGNIFGAMRPVCFSSRPNLAGIFSKGQSPFRVDKVPCNVTVMTVAEIPPDVLLGGPEGWPAIELPTSWITHAGGSCFACDLETMRPGDDADHPDFSMIRVYEDGLQLGPPHASHDEIQAFGAGRYSHWQEKLYFSSSDGSDPRANGRRYEVRSPGFDATSDPNRWPAVTLPAASIRSEAGSCFVVDLATVEPSDGEDRPTASAVRLYEDGLQLGPPHEPHDEIRESGAGRYSHWRGKLYFSSSDGSDPRINGRSYEVRAPAESDHNAASKNRAARAAEQ